MLNNDHIMASICHNSAANFIHGSDMKTRQWRKTGSSSDAIFTWCCSFSSSLYARLERTENPSIWVLKTQRVQPVFGGFLGPTGHIRNGLLQSGALSLKAGAGPQSAGPSWSEQRDGKVFTVSNESPLATPTTARSQPFLQLTDEQEKISTTSKKL